MPGAFAHITLANMMKRTERLESIFGSSTEAITSVLDYFKFCELGAVSPDYPYLAVGDSDAAKWADAMHYTRTGEMIKSGIKHIKLLSGEPKRKAFAWLLGYSAHVVTDVTIHPIVQLKVGDYEQNKKEHRVCEMNQDAYIFQRLNLGEVGLSEHLDSGIGSCSDISDDDLLDRDIATLWKKMLQDVHPEMFGINPPDIDKWHGGFVYMVDDVAEEGNHLFPLARHVAAGIGLTYPSVADIDQQFIQDLNVPTGNQMDYDLIFDEAIQNVSDLWKTIGLGLYANNIQYMAKIGLWNLDTGRNENDQLVYWG